MQQADDWLGIPQVHPCLAAQGHPGGHSPSGREGSWPRSLRLEIRWPLSSVCDR